MIACCYTSPMTSSALSAIIIDFDDTLCMTEEACFELENEVLRRMGRQAQSREVHRQTWGPQLEVAMQTRSPGIDMGEFWRVLDVVRPEFIAAGRFDQVSQASLEALDTLASDGYRLFILTSRVEREVLHLLDPSHHLAGRITEIYHADNTTHIKPDPRAFDALLATHNLSPEECIYVGDSPSDGIAAKGAGMHFIASFESGLRTSDDFADIAIDATISHFTELPAAIKSLQTKIAA